MERFGQHVLAGQPPALLYQKWCPWQAAAPIVCLRQRLVAPLLAVERRGGGSVAAGPVHGAVARTGNPSHPWFRRASRPARPAPRRGANPTSRALAGQRPGGCESRARLHPRCAITMRALMHPLGVTAITSMSFEWARAADWSATSGPATNAPLAVCAYGGR